jgi:hypothetical protein
MDENPGEGSTRECPQPKRVYNALTLFLQKTFNDNWEAQASYTLSYLNGNYAGLFRPETAQLDPLTNSDYDLKSLTINRSGPLPGDTRHAFKLFGSKGFDVSDHSLVSFGGSVRAASGQPTSYLGSHPLYGTDEVFILPRGEGNRLPWVYNLDTSVSYTVKFAESQSITASLDVFNLLNFQEITARDETYTRSDVNPVVGGTIARLGELRGVDGKLIQKSEVNKNFGNPLGFQAPRQIKFGLRGTF